MNVNDAEPSVRDLLALALEYHRAAKAVAPLGRRRQPLSRAPCRLLSIHALELYLSAVLRHHGLTSGEVRAFGHDLEQRVAKAEAFGLRLRKNTREHLVSLSSSREYVVSRYRPDRLKDASQPNRLAASLKEVAEKVAASLSKAPVAKAA